MKRLYKATVITAIMVAVIAGAYLVGFQHAYQRYAFYNINVGRMSLHVEWKIEYNDGRVEYQYHAGVITNIGFDWIQDHIGDYGTDPVDDATVISLSTSTSTPLATWTAIPTEITTGGLERANGTYTKASDTEWTVEYQFTASATHTGVQLTGLQWKLTPLTNNLFGADTFTPVTLSSGEKLTVTATITLS